MVFRLPAYKAAPYAVFLTVAFLAGMAFQPSVSACERVHGCSGAVVSEACFSDSCSTQSCKTGQCCYWQYIDCGASIGHDVICGGQCGGDLLIMD